MISNESADFVNEKKIKAQGKKGFAQGQGCHSGQSMGCLSTLPLPGSPLFQLTSYLTTALQMLMY